MCIAVRNKHRPISIRPALCYQRTDNLLCAIIPFLEAATKMKSGFRCFTSLQGETDVYVDMGRCHV